MSESGTLSAVFNGMNFHDMRYAISPNAVDCPLGDGLAILDSRTGACFNLNRTGALIWNTARQQPVSFGQLHDMLAAACKGNPASIEQDLRTILSALVESGLFICTSGETAQAPIAHAD